MSSSNVKGADMKSTPKMPPPGQHTKGVLHQRRTLPFGPAKMALGGFAVVLTLGYFILYSKKKTEVTAIDVARVVTGVSATPENTYPRK